MGVSRNNSRLFLALVLGMFLASGCSGHSVKYGANSEGEGMASEGEMTGTVDGVSSGTARHADGTLIHGGNKGNSSIPGSGSNYGREFGGVDGSGPNHGGVTGLGSGSANASNPDPEAWANAYLREKRSSQGFYGDPSTNGEASSMANNPETWAQAYVKENGGPSPEYVNPDMNIAQANGSQDSPSMGVRNPSGEYLEIRDTSGSFGGRVQDIYFAFDSWNISAEGAKYLEEDAKWLHANPEKALTIEGHCDQRGTQDYNLVLGKKRAEAAREYLVNLGIQPHRINIVSYGKERPFCQNDDENCFQENRRNHMVVRMNQS